MSAGIFATREVVVVPSEYREPFERAFFET